MALLLIIYYADEVGSAKEVVAVTDAFPMTGNVFQTWFVFPSVHVHNCGRVPAAVLPSVRSRHFPWSVQASLRHLVSTIVK